MNLIDKIKAELPKEGNHGPFIYGVRVAFIRAIQIIESHEEIVVPIVKPKARMSNWEIKKSVYSDAYILYGTISGHPRVLDGCGSHTSRILTVNFQTKIVETLNTIYELV